MGRFPRQRDICLVRYRVAYLCSLSWGWLFYEAWLQRDASKDSPSSWILSGSTLHVPLAFAESEHLTVYCCRTSRYFEHSTFPFERVTYAVTFSKSSLAFRSSHYNSPIRYRSFGVLSPTRSFIKPDSRTAKTGDLSKETDFRSSMALWKFPGTRSLCWAPFWNFSSDHMPRNTSINN